MQIESLIKKYLHQGRVAQVATLRNDQPWICSVYYVEDEKQNIYWLSFPERRHSQEIAEHNKVAVAIVIKAEQPVIGLQVEGTVVTVSDPKVISEIMERYTMRHDSGRDFYNNFVAGKNHHVLYRFTPVKFGLFDEATFDDGIRKEWVVS